MVPRIFGNCKIALMTISPSLLCFSPPATDSAARRRLPGFPGHQFAVRWLPRVAGELLPLLLPRAGAPTPRHAPPPSPEPPRRPPPRRRRGEPKPEAQLSLFRAPEHYKNPRLRFHSPLCSLPASRPQNTPPLHRERRRASPRRGAANPDPLHPYIPHH